MNHESKCVGCEMHMSSCEIRGYFNINIWTLILGQENIWLSKIKCVVNFIQLIRDIIY